VTDLNRKTQRGFQCKDALWQKFEQMARELECSVDYLINDAMKQYARQRGYDAGTNASGVAVNASMPPNASAPPSSSSGAHALATPAPPPPPAASHSLVAPPPPVPGASRGAPPPPAPGKRSNMAPPPPAHAPAAPPPPAARRGPPPLAPSRSMPPPPAAARAATAPPPAAAAQNAGSKLSIHYQGEAFPVTKDRFIIGRGKQTSDLTIKDPNVSRQHAMIEFLNGQYYIVDMGSTNGVEFNGQRVQRKVINEGDHFKVCDHEISFSYN